MNPAERKDPEDDLDKDLSELDGRFLDSRMTEEEIMLRDAINKELTKKGFRLRVASLTVKDDFYAFHFVPPILLDEFHGAEEIASNLIEDYIHT